MLLALFACVAPPAPQVPEVTDPVTPTDPTTVDPTDPTTDPSTLVITDVAAVLSDRVGSILVVSWNQGAPADTHLEFSFDAGEWRSSPVKTRKAGPQTDLVLGAPYDSTVTWRLVATDGTTTFVSPDTATDNAALPSTIPAQTILVNDLAQRDLVAAPYWLVGLAVVSWSTDPWWVVILDEDGRVVWANRTPNNRGSMHARVARDGKTLLLDRNAFWSIFDADLSTIDQLTIDGSVVRTIQTPGLHHPFVDLPDGTIAYGASLPTGETIRLVHPDDTAEDLFDCDEWLSDVGIPYGCASNTLTYHEPTNTLLFSLYNVETIVEVDYGTGAATRWFGQVPGSYAFDPPQSAFWWQHGGYITEAGTLLTSSDLNTNGTETVVREYEIDEANETLVEIWRFGIGEGLYGGVMGEATRLPNGNTVHNYGGLTRMREVTSDGDVVLDIAWEGGGIGRTMPIADLYALAP